MLQKGYLHQNWVEFHVIGPIVILAIPTKSLTGQTGHLSVQKFMSSHNGLSVQRLPLDVATGKHLT